MGLFSLSEKCFLCHQDTGFNKHKTSHGFICNNCLDAVGKQGINLINIKKYSAAELRTYILNIANTQTEEHQATIHERAHEKFLELQNTKNIGPLQINNSHKLFKINGYIEVKGKLKKIKSDNWMNFSDLISYTLIENSETIFTGGIGHALIGGALFGAGGAAAGCMMGMKEKKKIDKLQIKVTVNNFDTPIIIIPLIQKAIKSDNKEYVKACELANNIMAAFDIIAHNN